jgi:ubiquinone/menaquinone biosynthesis C-methylase UbiE
MPEASIRMLRSVDRLREPAIASAIETLRLPKGSHGLDAGCGIGSHTGLLVRATSPGGRVTGLDSCAEHLAVAMEAARQGGVSDRASFRQGDVRALPFEQASFDWAWSADCVGFIPGDPVEMVRGLVRVVKPGGIVALLLWSSQQLLPGYPILEARLNGTRAGAAPATAEWPPWRHPLRSIGWLSRAGLRGPTARTFVVDVHAPLQEDQKSALGCVIEMRWGHPESELSEADWNVFERLVDRASPDSVVESEDYFGFFTYSLFWGRVPGRPDPESAPQGRLEGQPWLWGRGSTTKRGGR